MLNENQLVMAMANAEISECSCTTCANMCRRSPCIGTPSDIMALINAGHKEKLSLVIWCAGRPYGIPPIDMVQINPHNESVDLPCTFFNADNLCDLHNSGLKPLEGKIAHHDRIKLERNVVPSAFAIAATWLKPENKKLISEINKHFI